MNKPLAGCQLQQVAGERLPSLPGDQADDYPVGEGGGTKSSCNQLWPGNVQLGQVQPVCL